MNLISRHRTEGEIRFKILQLHCTPVHVHHTESELFILLPQVFFVDTREKKEKNLFLPYTGKFDLIYLYIHCYCTTVMGPFDSKHKGN